MLVTIDRSKWRCGGNKLPSMRGKGQTCLLNNEGFKCCLGSYGEALGIDPQLIKHRHTPGNLIEILVKAAAKIPDGLLKLILEPHTGEWSNSDYACQAMSINDRDTLTDSEREQKLIALAARHGDEWKFVGKYNSQ